jgi:hypothetical protein
VVRESGESRDSYLTRYLDFMRREWTDVPTDQLEEACAHVARYDYPETFDDLDQMARRAGFSEVRLVDRFGPHQVIILNA